MILSHTFYPLTGISPLTDTQSPYKSRHTWYTHSQGSHFRVKYFSFIFFQRLFWECVGRFTHAGRSSHRPLESGLKLCFSETKARLFTCCSYIGLPGACRALVTRILFPFKGCKLKKKKKLPYLQNTISELNLAGQLVPQDQTATFLMEWMLNLLQ